MDTSSPTNRSGDPLLAGLLAGIVVATLDLTSLDGRLYLVVTLAALHAATGLVVGIGMTVTRWWADRRGWQGWRSALLHAAPVLFLLVPLAPRLFDGSFAATLPGAAAAPYLVPLAGWLLVALAVRIGSAWYGDRTPLRRATLSAALLFAACAMEWANRTLYRSGYPEIHAALVAAAEQAGVAVVVEVEDAAQDADQVTRVGAGDAAPVVG